MPKTCTCIVFCLGVPISTDKNGSVQYFIQAILITFALSGVIKMEHTITAGKIRQD